MGEDRTSLVVERAVAILTEIALKVPIAAVLDRAVRTAAETGNSISQRSCCNRPIATDSDPNTSSGIIRIGHR